MSSRVARWSRTAFALHPIAAAVATMRQALARSARADPSRRSFLWAGAGGALALGLPLLSACGGSDDPSPAAPSGPAATTLTLFFNYAHLDTAGRSMSIQVGQHSYRLRAMAEAPGVLQRERSTNRFLAALDDRYITHVVEGVPAPAPGEVSFAYGVTDLADGQWTMDSLGLLLPESSAVPGFERAVRRFGSGLPLSAKRRKYGLPPATSAKEMHDEQALQDTVSHAATLITMHKDMVALDGNAASTVVNSHVMTHVAGLNDIVDAIGELGTAAPEITKGQPNQLGWATLRPLLDADGNMRRIVAAAGDPANGRIVYMPVLHLDVSTLVGQNVVEILPQVQNDAELGADVTAQPAGSSLRGCLWVRRDGEPTIRRPPAAAGDAPKPMIDVQWPNGQNHWLDCAATAGNLDGGSRRVDVQFSNTGLRYLGCFIEFYTEGSTTPIQLDTLPGWSDHSWLIAPAQLDYELEDGKKTRLYIGSIASLGTIMGIPVFTNPAFYGSLELTMLLPQSVQRIVVYSGGLGAGSNQYPETIAGGVAATMMVNYVLTILFGAIGAVPDLDALFALIATIGADLIFSLGAALTDGLSGNNWLTPQFWIDQGMNLLNLLLGIIVDSADPILRTFGVGLLGLIGVAVAESTIEKAIPIVGIILNIESAVAATADFVLTTVAVAQSPFTYVTRLVFTYDMAVSISPSNDTTFPAGANVMTLIATFDDGKPHRQDIALQASAGYPQTVPPTVFIGAPLGGSVEIKVEFHQRALDSTLTTDTLLGMGTSGKVANDELTAHAVVITEFAAPIGPGSKYEHQQRTYLDASNNHRWVIEGAPSTPPSQFQCGSAGEVCAFNGITVRQGVSLPAPASTVVGYAWRAQNPGGGGDTGQQALMNVDDPSAGYAVDSNAKWADGLEIVFSRNSGGTDNYYVDPSGAKPMIRGITLDGAGAPRFDSGMSYGMLNRPSSALLVHPSGYLISICAGSDRFEVLRPPSAPVSDSTAQMQYTAQVVGGTGDLPGKLNGVVAATITKDGSLLMLEGGNNRVQALDVGSNPVRYFANAAVPYFLPLSDLPISGGWVHLDIQADFGGLVYVLSTNGAGVFRVSIYDQKATLQQALSFTEGIYAARIALDQFRNLYTLNYQPISVRNGAAPPPVTEPSVSRWIPRL